MKEYQERVITEKKELDDKAKKLSVFLIKAKFGDMSLMDVDLLKTQHYHMARYQSILEARIKLFEFE